MLLMWLRISNLGLNRTDWCCLESSRASLGKLWPIGLVLWVLVSGHSGLILGGLVFILETLLIFLSYHTITSNKKVITASNHFEQTKVGVLRLHFAWDQSIFYYQIL